MLGKNAYFTWQAATIILYSMLSTYSDNISKLNILNFQINVSLHSIINLSKWYDCIIDLHNNDFGIGESNNYRQRKQ